MNQTVEYGPFKDGYVAAVDRTRVGPQGIAEDSVDCGIDPTTGAVFLRPGSAIVFDDPTTPVGLLESKWGAIAQDLLAFLSDSFTDAMENLLGLWSDETDKEAQLWFRSTNGAPDTNQTIGKSYGTFHRSSAAATVWNFQMIPLLTDHATQIFTRCKDELSRRVIASGSRNVLRIGSDLIAPCRTGTPFIWNGRFNDASGAGTEKEFVRPLGPIPPLFRIRQNAVAVSTTGLWLGGNNAIWSYSFKFKNGDVSQPYRANSGDVITVDPNPANAALPYPYVDLVIPPGPRDCIGRIVLRTNKWATGAVAQNADALLICGYIDNNFQTAYRDTQGDDAELVSRPDLIRFDLIMPPRARKYGTMDGRIVAVDLQANPCAIFLAPYSRNSVTPADTAQYDDVAAYPATAFFFNLDGTNLYLKESPFGVGVVNQTIALAGITLQGLVNAINAIAPTGATQPWRAQLAPGMDGNALAIDLQPTNGANYFDDDGICTGGATATGNCRVIASQTLPGCLYMKATSSWMTRSIDPRGVHFTMANPATTGTETDAPLAPNAWKGGFDCRRRLEGGMGRAVGVGSLLDGALILATRGTAVLRNVRGGKTGADTDYRLERWLIGDGVLGPDAYAEGDGWVVYARRAGIMVNDGKREVCISTRVFNPTSGTGGRGPWKYEWSQCKKWQAKNDQSAHLHIFVAHGRIFVTYRSSSSVTTPDRMMVYNFTAGQNGLGVDQVLRDDGTPFAWSAPYRLNGSVMGAVTRDDGDHLYMVRSDYTAATTGDGRVDEFEITTSTQDNGASYQMAAHLATDRFGAQRQKKRLVRATIEYYDATGGGSVTGYIDFARTLSGSLSALPAVTDGTVGNVGIVRCPASLRAPFKTLEMKIQNPSGSARFELFKISAEVKFLNTVGP